jgi:hypothetical protein
MQKSLASLIALGLWTFADTAEAQLQRDLAAQQCGASTKICRARDRGSVLECGLSRGSWPLGAACQCATGRVETIKDRNNTIIDVRSIFASGSVVCTTPNRFTPLPRFGTGR